MGVTPQDTAKGASQAVYDLSVVCTIFAQQALRMADARARTTSPCAVLKTACLHVNSDPYHLNVA